MEKRLERFCEIIKKDVRIKINLALIEILGGDEPVIQGGESRCSDKNECKIKQCRLITEEEEIFEKELRSEYKESKKRAKEWDF